MISQIFLIFFILFNLKMQTILNIYALNKFITSLLIMEDAFDAFIQEHTNTLMES